MLLKRKAMENLRAIKETAGFTLIELSIVMLVSSLMLAGMISIYSVYLKAANLEEARNKQLYMAAAISTFGNTLPCPSDPSLGVLNPNSGVADCSLYAAYVPGTAVVPACTNGIASPNPGICLVSGARDSDGDGFNDPVLIGAFPYKTVQATVTDADGTTGLAIANSSGSLSDNMNLDITLDPWDYQMMYAVSARMTDNLTNGPENGALHVQTELGTDITDPIGSAHYILVSYGENHVGAYTSNGIITTPCATILGTAEADNCDNDAVFVQGLRSLALGPLYFDDTVRSRTFAISKLWEFSDYNLTPSDPLSVYNLNSGNVGVGISAPLEQLHVNEEMKATKISQQLICDSGGGDLVSGNCFKPTVLTSSGTVCSDNYPAPAAGNVLVAVGIAKGTVTGERGNVVCQEIPLVNMLLNQTCPVGQYAVGFTGAGVIICSP